MKRLRLLLLPLVVVTAGIGVVSPVFADVPPGGSFFDDDGSVHEGAIEAIAAAGITVGCDVLGERFCPDRAVTRAEMATLLVRALGVAPRDPVRFVDATGVHRSSIGAAEAEGWFKGCDPPVNELFCPDDVLTRGQAAAVLVRAFDLPPGEVLFGDVTGSVFAADIGALAAAGVTRGCDPPSNELFCPDRPVTRAEMATFLTRLLGLTPETPPPAFQGRIVLGLYSDLVINGGIATIEGNREPRPLLEQTVGEPALSPDGRMVAYFDFRRECPPDAIGPWSCYRRIFTVPFEGGAETQMTPNDFVPSGHAWLPGGASLSVFDVREIGDGEDNLFWYLDIVDVISPLVTTEVAGPFYYALSNPDWSIDDELVAQAQEDLGYSKLLILDADGNEQSLISVADTNLLAPAWSPDGSLLAYVADDSESGYSELVISAPNGSDRRVVVTAEDGIGDIAWSPDGSLIAFIRDRRAWAMPVSGGAAWPLTPSDVQVLDLDWSVAP